MTTKLETDTHTLQLFKDPLFFTLLEKRRPECAKPERLTSTHELQTVLDDPTSHLAHVSLAGVPIGDVEGQEEIDQLAQFVADWRQELVSLSPSPSSSNSSRHGSGSRMRATSSTAIGTLGSAIESGISILGGLGKERAKEKDKDRFRIKDRALPFRNRSTNPSTSRSSTDSPIVGFSTNNDQRPSVGEVRDAELISGKNAYLVDSSVSIRTITWNLHGESLSDQDLMPLIVEKDAQNPHDIVVLFVQESDVLSKNIYANSMTLEKTRAHLIDALNKSLEEFDCNKGRSRSETVSSLDSASHIATTKLSQSQVDPSATSPDKKDSDPYEYVAHNQLLGLMTIVAARSSIAQQISDVFCSSTGTGLFGIWGNKGAIMVKFHLGGDPAVHEEGTLIKLVNCHLTAGESNQSLDRRRWELAEIATKFRIGGLVAGVGDTKDSENGVSGVRSIDDLIFDTDAPELNIESDEDDTESNVDENADNLAASVADDNSETLVADSSDLNQSTLPSTDYSKLTILGGDLNYRLAMDSDLIDDYVQRGDFNTVLIHDGLSKEIRSKRVFTQFSEGTIRFPPTYKYSIGSQDLYDRERTPSYTDRIFYQTLPRIDSNKLEVSGYQSFPEYTISDHKPVALTSRLVCKLINFDERHKIVEKALRKLDLVENAARPVVNLEPLDVHLGGPVLSEQTSYITMTLDARDTVEQSYVKTDNLVQWEAVNPESENTKTGSKRKLGLTIEPRRGYLPSGAKQQIKLCYSIGIEDEPQDLVLVFRVKNVRDIFVTIRLEPLPTCLGCSLDMLCRMPLGARQGMSDAPASNMPREIWNCVDFMWARVVPDMFWQKGDPSVQSQILSWMDNGQQFDIEVLDAASEIQPNVGVYSVAQQFLLLLRQLKGGIIPADFYYLVVRGASGVNPLLESMASVHVNVLIYIAGFIAKAVADGVDKKSILDLFLPLIIKVPRVKQSSKDKIASRELLEALIWNA